ncbi:uncharacterized protein LOC126735091 [Anthonomus grandis grandis]|uniref:uncharacterized protein LOC126735091 n=1 Tax=Anthonomus grandis grandis TaxID=2921223 RepID=UPI00216648CE|nr:uncharacterized protein LOC126735091 [Anthonomus grandis grandis]
MENMLLEKPNFLNEILWTDKATFNSDGGVNRHNMHYRSETNPRWMREIQHQGRWSVNVWCGVIGSQVIGPFLFDKSLTGVRYLGFLRNELPALLEEVPLVIRANMFLQHDGCPAHFAVQVRTFLNQRYPDRWIGRGSFFPWPARSPDLTCLDFYLWGRIKAIVFSSIPTNRENMKQ